MKFFCVGCGQELPDATSPLCSVCSCCQHPDCSQLVVDEGDSTKSYRWFLQQGRRRLQRCREHRSAPDVFDAQGGYCSGCQHYTTKVQSWSVRPVLDTQEEKEPQIGPSYTLYRCRSCGPAPLSCPQCDGQSYVEVEGRNTPCPLHQCRSCRRNDVSVQPRTLAGVEGEAPAPWVCDECWQNSGRWCHQCGYYLDQEVFYTGRILKQASEYTDLFFSNPQEWRCGDCCECKSHGPGTLHSLGVRDHNPRCVLCQQETKEAGAALMNMRGRTSPYTRKTPLKPEARLLFDEEGPKLFDHLQTHLQARSGSVEMTRQQRKEAIVLWARDYQRQHAERYKAVLDQLLTPPASGSKPSRTDMPFSRFQCRNSLRILPGPPNKRRRTS